ncbi:MAG: UbiA family prenyltransferase [Pseudomonadota bacterium]
MQDLQTNQSAIPPELPASGCVLAVDLDGTLLNSDMLFESFWSVFGRAPGAGLAALIRPGLGDRAGLKAAFAKLMRFDPAELPYNDEVLAYITAWREAGGRVALVTASDQSLAARIASHLGLFDAVHGSSETRNLKGAAKAALLEAEYGSENGGGGFVYMGDATPDLEVWAKARQIVTVNAGAGLRRAAEALGPPVVHLGQAGPDPWAVLKALRPHQWLKNMLIFVPVVAGHAWSWGTIGQLLLAFLAFSLTASSVYLMNDLMDLSADRQHPRKRSRPIAAGTMPIALASAGAPVLLLVAFCLALPLGSQFLAVLGIYLLLTTGYSVYLKRRTIVDIWVLAMLYSLRILAGAAATGLVPSVWLLAFSIFFFFALAAVKRQAELVDMTLRERRAMPRRGYHADDLLLISMMGIAAGYVSVLVMALYVRSPDVAELYATPQLLLGICLILLYWISRIVMVTHRGQMHDDPLVFALRDRVSLACLALMGACAFLAAA